MKFLKSALMVLMVATLCICGSVKTQAQTPTASANWYNGFGSGDTSISCTITGDFYAWEEADYYTSTEVNINLVTVNYFNGSNDVISTQYFDLSGGYNGNDTEYYSDDTTTNQSLGLLGNGGFGSGQGTASAIPPGADETTSVTWGSFTVANAPSGWAYAQLSFRVAVTFTVTENLDSSQEQLVTGFYSYTQATFQINKPR